MAFYKNILYALFVIIYKPTTEHYIPPPSACLLAQICNHTGITLCGLEQNKRCYRLFLDECDMFEYNCDNQAVFFESQMNNCINGTDKQEINKVKNTTTKETTIKATTEAVNVTISSTETDLSDHSTSEKTGTIYYPETTNNPTTTTSISNLTNTVESSTLPIDIISTENTLSASESVEVKTTLNIDTIVANATTTDSIPDLTTTEISTLEMHITNLTTTNFPDTEVITIKSNLSETSVDVTTMAYNLNSRSTIFETTINIPITNATTNFPKSIETIPIISTIEINITTVQIPTTSVSSKEIDNLTTIQSEYSTAVKNVAAIKNATKSSTVSSKTEAVNTCGYPSYCDRPKHWETTAKGETRDFHRILRERYGKRSRTVSAAPSLRRRYMRIFQARHIDAYEY